MVDRMQSQGSERVCSRRDLPAPRRGSACDHTGRGHDNPQGVDPRTKKTKETVGERISQHLGMNLPGARRNDVP